MRVLGGASTSLLAASAVWLVAAGLTAPQATNPPKVNFGRDVLPILSDKCFKCHGPDAGSRMANMRLDTPEGAFADRGGRWPIVPGKPEDSLVVQRITSHDAPMPPVVSGKTLSKEEIDILTRWIAEGARYGKLWSFEPLPAEVPVPKVQSAWPRDDLDRFVLARLQREQLQPSGEASRPRWLRRVTLDLTGLPPTEAELAAFRGDARPDAYERVVDRLLASPHFGERLAVDWLDAARYADSYGYQSDLLMPMWPYRDWVVQAFNENKPYDQFLVEQLAGDLLPDATRDQRLATAFNRLHRQSNEGGSIALEFKTEYAVDRVSTFGTAVLGLTVGCARCHDHKFDPITQREFYGLFAYFNSIKEFGLLLSSEIVPTPSLLLPTAAQEARLAELHANSDAAVAALRQAEKERAPGAKGPLDLRARFDLDSTADKFLSDDGKTVGAKFGKLETAEGRRGKGVLFDGDDGLAIRGLPGKERWDAFTWSFWLADPRQPEPVVVLHRTGGTDVGFCGFDLLLEDGRLTARVMRHWPGNAVAIRTLAQLPKGQWTHVAWTWDGSGRADGLKLYVDGRPAPTEVLADRLWKKINAYGDLGPGGGDWTFGTRFRDAGFKGGKVDEIAFADRALPADSILSLFQGDTTGAAIDPKVEAAQAEVQESQRALAEFEEGIREISVMEEAQPEIPAYVLARGRYDAPRTEATRVERGVPAVLPPLDPEGPNNRLALARWATRPNHPLTSRVAVNRIWQMLFGTGLVETSENFGVQGSRPTHPELLDYLARWFVDSGWDTKALVRKIVLSATYRQDSTRTAARQERDPDNKLLARGPSHRLTGEMMRDTALAAAGLLNPAVGGPPVNPYQPAGIWRENNAMTPGFVQSKGADLYRRSLYSTWKRTTPVPSMMAFDATSREACSMRRPPTNTPMQALVLLNDVQFVEAARVLAEHVLALPVPDAQRLRTAFVRLAGREPDAKEQAILMQTLQEQRLQYRADVSGAAKLLEVGDKPADSKLRPTEVAAMTTVVQMVLSSDAVVWKR
ncbi:MAG: DUF1553 domain-containing protein [Fimbriimonadaceae bacterium]|nr:DUF1553 domain-containing protein [Fimbriimonadaceae bacterium]